MLLRPARFAPLTRWLAFALGVAAVAGCASGLQVGGAIDPGFPSDLAADLTAGLAGSWDEGFQAAVILEDGSTWTYQEETGTAGAHRADIGSIGKTFEAALVLRLAEEGVIDLDGSVDSWIEAPPGVTVRHLLQHTSGIASDDRDLPPVCDPGSCQSYSNSGYEMVAELVDQATGEDHREVLDRLVVEPLGLTEIGLEPESILSTAEGVARFGRGLYRGDLLEQGSLETMLDFSSVLSLPGSNECETMGLGTVRRHVEGLGQSWGHGGWTSESRTWLEYFPESGVSFAVITNGGADFLPLGPIYEALGSHLPETTTPMPCDHDLAELVRGDETMITERRGYDGQPALASDGSTLAFLSVFDDGIDIVLHGLATSDEERLRMEGWEVVPRWAPDGGLVYSSDIDGDREVYHMDITSQELTQLTSNDVDDHQASFSPDGRQIVYVRGGLGEGGLWMMNADGTGQHRVEGTLDDAQWPAWSPNGRQLVYVSGGVPYVIDVERGDQYRVPIEQIRVVFTPSWAPGPDILFSADGDIWSVSSDGSGLTRLTGTPSVEEMPVWGRDGSIFYQTWHLVQQ